VAQLRHFETELRRMDVQVLVISFGAEFWASAWLQETQLPFPLLLDPERAAYRAYGLERSFVRVWSPKVMWHYMRRVLAGQKLQSIQGDPHQLGGDFVVDAAGVIRLAHRSRDPVDRPAVETLVAAFKETRP
jgi:alkyl hydroperoxide reductase subunit AhpC